MSHARLDGFKVFAGFLDRQQQEKLVKQVSQAVKAAPLFHPVMPRSGKPFSVRMTNLGKSGWVSDKTGYRYQAFHPVTGQTWPQIPAEIIDIWKQVTACEEVPDACLVNYYTETARMGLHVDKDERDFRLPVVSISLGDSAVFRLGGTNRKDPTRSMKLVSGDVVVLGGKARLCYHGIDRIMSGSSSLLSGGGRLNLTLRCTGALPQIRQTVK